MNFQRCQFCQFCVSEITNEPKFLSFFSAKKHLPLDEEIHYVSKSIHNIRNILFQELEFLNISNRNVVLMKMFKLCLPERKFSRRIVLNFTVCIVPVSHFARFIASHSL